MESGVSCPPPLHHKSVSPPGSSSSYTSPLPVLSDTTKGRSYDGEPLQLNIIQLLVESYLWTKTCNSEKNNFNHTTNNVCSQGIAEVDSTLKNAIVNNHQDIYWLLAAQTALLQSNLCSIKNGIFILISFLDLGCWVQF